MRVILLILSLLVAVEALASEANFAQAIQHEPLQPKPDEGVLITAKLPVGVMSAVLKLQSVAPGKYVRKTDPGYEAGWTELPMQSADGLFRVQVPGKYQQHRHLIRYRIVVTERDGKTTRFPVGDTCPNFAYWCDAGPAAWTGRRDPGQGSVVTASPEFLGTMQSLHLIANAEDVAKSQWDGNFHKQKQLGTIVYRGIVYDHISYTNRGQGSAHISGKNKWSLKFHKSQELPMVGHDGVPFPDTCETLALNPGGSTPHLPILRGIAGLDEVLSMRAYRLAGVPSPPSTWVQWRVVDHVDEVSSKDQYTGDLWGLYVAMGEMTPNLLADNKLPDGLVVSIQSGIKHTPKGMTNAEKTWETFLNTARSNPKEDWWRANLDLPSYFSFHAMNRLLSNVDLRPDGNHGYYRAPDGKWRPIPWDNDMMFVPRHHQPGYIDAIGCLNHPRIALEFRNRAREILDLFAADASPQGGQIGQLVADLSKPITPKGHKLDWANLDAALWNHHPRMNQKGSYFVNPAQGHHFGGPWTRTLATNDFAGFQKYIIDFCTDSRPKKNYAPNDGNTRGYGWGYLAHEAKDDKIPKTPTVKETTPKQFQATPFDSPAKQKPAALEWRVARVGQVGLYELTDLWRSETPTGITIDIPANIFHAPGVYRIRARWRDDSGRCSHWSQPVTVRLPEEKPRP
jgi:hypothetical protein